MDTETRQYRTGDREVVVDLTRDCAAYVADRADGLLQLFVPHATAGIAIIETGAGSDDDLLSALGDLLPADDRWEHAHGSRGHGRSHVMPALVPPYATVPVLDGRLALGTWQSICLVDLNVDNDVRTVRFSFLEGVMAEIRPAVPEDHAAIDSVLGAAFGDDDGTISRLVADLRREHARAELVAEEGSGVVGHVLLSRSWLDARRALVDVLVLSPLSVAPGHQRRGVGSRLVEAAVAAARELRAPALFLEGSPDFYSARGFEPAAARGFLRPSARIPEPAFQVVVLEEHEAWMSGALVYGEPFWTHDCVGLRDPHLTSVEQAFES